MKKIILFIIFSLTVIVYGKENIEISQTKVKQGEFFYIKYPADKNYTIDFKISSNIKTFKLEDFKYAFIPVHYSNGVGKYSIKILENNTSIFDTRIEVEDGNFEKSYINVSEKMKEKRSSENLAKGSKAVSQIKNNPSDKLWEGKFIQPVEGEISSPFGAMRYVNNVVVGYHSGIDYPIEIGTPLKATNTGKVVFASELPTTGYTLVIDHGMNIFSSYSHMSSFQVKEGEVIKKGDIVGKSGNTGFTTGPHLHFTIAIGKIFVNPHLFFNEDIIKN